MKRNPSKFLFVTYCLILTWVILLKMATSMDGLRFLMVGRAINLVPLDYGVPIGIPQIREAALNTMLFLPMGIYLKMFGLSWKKAVFLGFGISLSFEVCQYILAIGVSDITDLMTNTLGAALGAGCYWLMRKLCSKEKTDRIINRAAVAVLLISAGLILLLTLAN